jgi:hypothetical protein
VGDPDVSLYGQPVGNGFSLHQFECPGSCSTLAIADLPEVTVLREYLHMHKTGARITNEQIRDGEVVRTGKIEYWEFDQNGNAAVQQDPFVIKPGDGFRTSCYYTANEDTVFGLSSQEEMCMAFLYYHPRIQVKVEDLPFDLSWICAYDIGFPLCDNTYEKTTLNDSEDLERTFGISNSECSAVPEDEPASSPSSDQDTSLSFPVDNEENTSSGFTPTVGLVSIAILLGVVAM